MTAFLITDTREQNPLSFRSTDNYTVITEKLDEGDYGLKIDDKLVCVFERKSGIDLYGSLTHGHERFRNEILRAKESGIAFYVIVEESYNNIIGKKFKGSYNSNVKGHVLAKILHTFSLRYDVHFIFCNNREEARDYIRNTFSCIINEFNRNTPLDSQLLQQEVKKLQHGQ